MPKFPMPKCKIFTNLYVDKEFVSFINSCWYLLGVGTANMTFLKVRTICNLRNSNLMQ